MVYRYLWHGHFVKRILAGFPPENLHAAAVILMAAERSPKKKLTRKLAAVGFGKVVICIQGRDASRGLCLVF